MVWDHHRTLLILLGWLLLLLMVKLSTLLLQILSQEVTVFIMIIFNVLTMVWNSYKFYYFNIILYLIFT